MGCCCKQKISSVRQSKSPQLPQHQHQEFSKDNQIEIINPTSDVRIKIVRSEIDRPKQQKISKVTASEIVRHLKGQTNLHNRGRQTVESAVQSQNTEPVNIEHVHHHRNVQLPDARASSNSSQTPGVAVVVPIENVQQDIQEEQYIPDEPYEQEDMRVNSNRNSQQNIAKLTTSYSETKHKQVDSHFNRPKSYPERSNTSYAFNQNNQQYISDLPRPKDD